MTVSGTHDSEVWNFVESAMIGFSGYTKISVYYFYMRCEENIDIDSNFQPFIDVSVKGDTTISLLEEEVDNNPTNSKKHNNNSDEILKSFLDQGNAILQHLAKATDIMKQASDDRKIAAEERKKVEEARQKKANFHARLEVAKALNDTEELMKLMEEAKSNH
jgi:hypothetical protein